LCKKAAELIAKVMC